MVVSSNQFVRVTNPDGTVSTVYIPASTLTTSQLAAMGYAVPNNYAPGYYNYPTYNYTPVSSSTAGMAYTYPGTTFYPGVPNTGGAIVTATANASGGFTTSNPATGTYIAPMTSYNGIGITGGVSIPVGYSPAIGPNGSILTTNNSNTSVYPGVPNTGGPIVNVNGYLNSNSSVNTGGQFRVSGIVTIVTPTAIGLSSGNMVWTVGWNSGTAITTANGTVGMPNGQIMVGDRIEVDGMLDSTFSSKINATAIRDLSFH